MTAAVAHGISTEELERIARTLRCHAVRTIAAANSGHPGGSLSVAEIVTTLYFGGVLRHDPRNPSWPDRDRLILSKDMVSRSCIRRWPSAATSRWKS
jgi:transketolase